MPLRSYPVKLTDEQVQAVEAAFPDSPLPFSEKLRALVAGGLAIYQVEWPPSPAHGGKRNGAGRKRGASGRRLTRRGECAMISLGQSREEMGYS